MAMSKAGQLKRTVNRAVQRQLTQEEHKRKNPRKRIAGLLLTVLGIPSLIVGILEILPRASVSPEELQNPSDPFSAPFIVANDGYVDLYDVTFLCSPIKVLTSTRGEIRADVGAGFSDTSFNVGTLGPDGRTTVFCPLYVMYMGPGPIKEAHIQIILSFRPEWLPFHRSIKRDFVLSKDAAGRYRWLHFSN